MLFHEKTRDKPITVERLDDMLIDEKNDKIQELEEENEVLIQKIEELEKTLNDVKDNLPLIRMKADAFSYKIQILKPSGKYDDFITVFKNVLADSEVSEYLAKEIYNMVQEGLQ